LARKNSGKVVTVQTDTPLTDVSALFQGNDFSQIPVMENEKVVGTLYEEKMLEHLLKRGADGMTRSKEIMEAPLNMVPPETKIEDILEVFQKGAGAVLVSTDKMSILTKFDLMQCLVGK
jgi:cystathionine beta-synthase